jgi:hypothetical protein
MKERNLDFDIPLTRDQWNELTQTAEALESLGYAWNGKDPERIHVRLRDEEARGAWEGFVSDEDVYGDHEVELGQFIYNDGRPYAHLEALPTVEEPSVTDRQEHEMQIGQERWVREKWHDLMERSGLHYERGHVSPGVR